MRRTDVSGSLVGLVLLLVLSPQTLLPPDARGDQDLVINEQFETLDNWQPVTFPGIEQRTVYETRRDDGRSVLVTTSRSSASGIRCRTQFDVYSFPVLRWSWKVENVYRAGDLEKKSGDDYPLRVYVMFEYDPEAASFSEKVQYSLAKMLYGAYPPKNSLNYIWANRQHLQRIYPSMYTDRAQLIILRAGAGEAGKWVEEEVNILEDYREAFGGLPPAKAAIAIMNDSDNTGEAAVSYMDYIQVLSDK